MNKFYQILILLFVSISSVFAQSTFKFSGQIINPTNKKIIITIYRNNIEDEEEYELLLDEKNSFYFSTRLNGISYLDFHYGEDGFNYWAIEPDDDIYLKFNGKDFWNSFLPTGKGSSRWIYYMQNHINNYIKRDWEMTAAKWQEKYKLKDYFTRLEFEQTNQLNFLYTYSSVCTKDFIALRAADIIGQIQNLKVDFLYNDENLKLSNKDLYELLNISQVNPSNRIKSYQFTEFGNNLIDLFAYKEVKDNLSPEKAIEVAKQHIEGLSKEFVEHIVAFKMKLSLETETLDDLNVDVLNANIDYIEDRDIKNYFYSKINFLQGIQKGSEAKKFVLKNFEGENIYAKTFEGKIIYMIFWANWCNPCLYDHQFLQKVKETFQDTDEVVFLYISMDSEEDWKKNNFKKEKNVYQLWVHPDSRLFKDFGIKGVPAYFLIDKNGKFATEKVADPSQDEGLELINQIKNLTTNND